MEKIEIRESRVARWVLFGITLSAAIAMSLIFASSEDKLIVGIAIAVFAVIAIKLITWAMSPGARVSLNDIGIEDTNNGFGLIEWRDIRSASVGRVDESEFISITVRNEAEYLERLSPMKRRMSGLGIKMGYSPIMIAMFNLKIKSLVLHSMIEERINR